MAGSPNAIRLPERMEATIARPMRVVVIGAGYVGLVTSACLAHLGHQVTNVDVDAERIKSLKDGVTPISEPGLSQLVREGLAEGRLFFETDLELWLRGADVACIAVGTLDHSGQWTDANVLSVLSQLINADTIPPHIVIRSTLRPGSMEALQAMVDASGRATCLVLNPEFTRQGSALTDFLEPYRIVVGAPPRTTGDDVALIRRMYAGVSAPLLVVNHATAELIKIGANAFLATKITFANELARVAGGTGADMPRVMEGIGLDPRIGQAFLQPGPGFGGSCLPNQIDLLTEMSNELGLGLEMISGVQRSNRNQPRRLARELLRASGPISRVAVFGLAFKANTDDIRESPALRFIDELAAAGIRDIDAYDPAVRRLPRSVPARISDDPYDAALGADVLAITTEWPEFRALEWPRLASRMPGRLVFDTRSIIDATRARKSGFDVVTAGSRAVNARSQANARQRREAPLGERAERGMPAPRQPV